MAIAYLELHLRIEAAHSLKDRRQVVRALKDGLRHHFNVSVAELDEVPTWQSATLGVVAVSGSRNYLAGQMEAVEHWAERSARDLGAEVAEAGWEWLEPDG